MDDLITELALNFRPPAFPGSYFLSFEGIEGSGKSTQIRLLKNYLETKNFNVIVLREPGGTSFGERLRQAILESKKTIHPVAEAHLFASARAQLLSEVLLKELETPSTIILADRYLDSSLAYQGNGRGLGIKTILEIHNKFPLNLVPHQTFYLKINVETSHQRQKMRNAPKDYFESQGDEFYNKLIEGYDLASQIFPQRIHTIDGIHDEQSTHQKITDLVDRLIEKKPSYPQDLS